MGMRQERKERRVRKDILGGNSHFLISEVKIISFKDVTPHYTDEESKR